MTSHNKAVKTSIHCASLLSAGPFISHSSFHPTLPPSSNPYPAQPMTAALPAWHSHHAFPSGSKRKVIFHSLFSSFSTVWHQLDGVHENASMLSLLHLSVAMHQGAVCTVHERTAANSLWLGHVWIVMDRWKTQITVWIWPVWFNVMGECSSPAFCHSFFDYILKSCHWLALNPAVNCLKCIIRNGTVNWCLLLSFKIVYFFCVTWSLKMPCMRCVGNICIMTSA